MILKVKPPIPKCKQCGCDLYPERRFFYDKRRKYCAVCAEERKRDKDAERMRRLRSEVREERTKEIKRLRNEVENLNEQISLLKAENANLRKIIISKD